MNPPADATEQPGHREADTVGLWSAFARSVRNNIVAEVVVQIVRIGGLIFLARALRPQDFGLLKVLTVVSAFVMLFIEAGIPEALIQRHDLRREHEVTAWWLTIAFSLMFVVTFYLAAPWVAVLMGMKNLTFGIRLLCIPILFEGVAICPNARMRRELRFGALAAADVIAETSFLVAALVVLFKGNPVWSLPAGLAARLAAHGLVIVAADRRLPLGPPRWSAARELCRFAASVMLGGNLLTSAASNADYLLVGRLLGTGALGFYSMAWDLLQFIPARLYRIAGRVALPAFCKLQDNDRELAVAYRNFVGYIGRVVLPMAGCVAIAAPELLESIYGPKWLPAAVPMRMLTAGLALLGLRIGIGTVYYAKNYPSIDIYLNGCRLIGIVIGVVLGATFGLLGVAGAVTIVESIVGIAGQYVVCRLIRMQLRELVIALIPGLRIAAATMLAAAFGKLLGMVLDIPAPLVLAVIAVPPGIVFCWLQSGELAGMARQAFGRTQPA
jgi:PST family polysaccharide transporter